MIQGYILITRTDSEVKIAAIEGLTLGDALQVLNIATQYFTNLLVQELAKQAEASKPKETEAMKEI